MRIAADPEPRPAFEAPGIPAGCRAPGRRRATMEDVLTSRSKVEPGNARGKVFRLGALAAGVVLAAAGCGGHAAKAPDKKAPEVVVTTPITDEVADYQDFTGRLDGLKNVDIRP